MPTTVPRSANRTRILTERAADGALRQHAAACTTGRRLAWAREAAGVSQAELGAYIGVSRTTVSRVEHGARMLRPAERSAAARALGASIATLAAPAIRVAPASNGANGNGRA